MSTTSPLAERMRAYEAPYRTVLPRRTYAILRVDGRSFHTYLRDAQKPYDATFMADMDAVARALCNEVSGAVFAYVQSDEISVLVQDFATPATEPWFGGVIAKQVSVAAATATGVFLGRRPGRLATFDARVFTVDDPDEVANYFVYRQRDCIRNSISMAGRAHFSHRRLRGMSTDQVLELLREEKGVDWQDYPTGARRGRVVGRKAEKQDVTYTHKGTGEQRTERAVRTWWAADGAPNFSAAPGTWLTRAIPPKPQEEASQP